jgi:hypothetical protein
MDARAPERLVGVDVPDSGGGALVEKRRLDRSLSTGEHALELRGRKAALEGLPPQPPLCEVLLALPRLEQRPRAETADVAIGNVRSVV